MLPPFKMTPRAGEQVSAQDLAMVFEMAYRAANISGSGPIQVIPGPGGIAIGLSSELPDISYLHLSDKFCFSGDNIAAPQRVRAYEDDPDAYTHEDPDLYPNSITFSAAGTQTIDGVALVQGDRVLLNIDGGDPDNGIYTVSTEGSSSTKAVWDRAVDQLTSNMTRAGQLVAVGPEGTTWGKTQWQLITPDPIVLNTDDLTYEQVGGGNVAWVKVTSLTLTAGRFPGELYDEDLADTGTAIWVTDVTDGTPVVGRFYLALRGTYANGRQVWRVNTVMGAGVSWVKVTSLTPTAGRLPGRLYDPDLTDTGINIWITDVNSGTPVTTRYYLALRGTDANSRQVWRIDSNPNDTLTWSNFSVGPIVVDASFDPITCTFTKTVATLALTLPTGSVVTLS